MKEGKHSREKIARRRVYALLLILAMAIISNVRWYYKDAKNGHYHSLTYWLLWLLISFAFFIAGLTIVFYLLKLINWFVATIKANKEDA
ncbi:MAG: hypothetical protein V4649_09565 [Bacteroidota bacterium]